MHGLTCEREPAAASSNGQRTVSSGSRAACCAQGCTRSHHSYVTPHRTWRLRACASKPSLIPTSELSESCFGLRTASDRTENAKYGFSGWGDPIERVVQLTTACVHEELPAPRHRPAQPAAIGGKALAPAPAANPGRSGRSLGLFERDLDLWQTPGPDAVSTPACTA